MFHSTHSCFLISWVHIWVCGDQPPFPSRVGSSIVILDLRNLKSQMAGRVGIVGGWNFPKNLINGEIGVTGGEWKISLIVIAMDQFHNSIQL